MFSITATTTTAVVARRASVAAPRRHAAASSRVAHVARADKSVSDAIASADEAWKAQGETAETEEVMNIITDKIDPADGCVCDRARVETRSFTLRCDDVDVTRSAPVDRRHRCVVRARSMARG